MAGIHYIFRKNPKTGELKLLNVTDTKMGAKTIKAEIIRTKRYNPSSIMIMEYVD